MPSISGPGPSPMDRFAGLPPASSGNDTVRGDQYMKQLMDADRGTDFIPNLTPDQRRDLSLLFRELQDEVKKLPGYPDELKISDVQKLVNTLKDESYIYNQVLPQEAKEYFDTNAAIYTNA